MSKYFTKLEHCYSQIREKCDFIPRVALVLGSGLGEFANGINIVKKINYREIDGFPVPTVNSHKGDMIFGYIDDMPVVIFQGRIHYDEGYDMTDVVLPIRIARMLGAEKLVLTNAAGGINESYSPGCFMLIRDHISSLVPSPLRGENVSELGTRFPDMSEVYSREIREKVKAAAQKLGTDLKEGVYIQTLGPQYETPAEISVYRLWGADAVGMSTAVEAIAARHAGMEVCGISCISNMAAGLNKTPLTHEEVKAVADNVSCRFAALLNEFIPKL